MRTSVSSPASPSAASRWRTSAVGTLVVALAAFLAGAVLATGQGGADGEAPVRAPFTRTAEDSGPLFRVASFNILGANHTDGPKANKRKQFKPSAKRTPQTVLSLDLNGVDVVGFQEMQVKQVDQFMKKTQGAWGLYPGRQLSNYAAHNSIGWRTAEWKLVEANSIPITYFNGQLVPMPYVLLRHLDTGRLVWFANFHNPASTKSRPPQAKWRKKAKAAQVALANRLHESGVPLVLTGDMNERETYFCAMTTQAPMKSASGGSWGASACKPPKDVRIDWVFGSNYLKFSNYRVNRGTLVKKITDHPMIVADVAVPVRPRY
jgi:endonuclease/exonuclease/phosphatase family metal-dependent hydrolase